MEPKEHFIEEVDIQRYWLVLKRRWLPASVIFAAAVGVAAFSALSQKPVYQASGKLLLQQDQSASLTGVSKELGELKSLMMTRDPLDTQEAIITSLPILEDAIRTLNIRDDQGALVTPEQLETGLTVTVVDGTDVLEVTYQSAQPELSAAVVNQIMQSYIATNIQSNRAEVKAARKFLEREVPKAEAELKQLSRTLQQFNEKNNIISLKDEASATVQAIANLDNQITIAQTQLAEADSRSTELARQLGMPLEDALTLSALSQSSSVQQSLTQWQAAESELAALRTRYTSQHPSVRVLERQEAALREILSDRVYEVAGTSIPLSSGTLQISGTTQKLAEDLAQAQVQRLGVYNQLAKLTATRDAYVEWADVFPSLEMTQQELTQRLTYARTTYENLLERLQEIRLAENQNVGSARVVEPAHVPAAAVVGGQLSYLVLGSVVGIFLGVATAFLLDLVDRSIKTGRDAEKLFGYITLGEIPTFELPQEADWQEMPAAFDGAISPRIVTTQNTFPMVAGAYQMLQANLRFISSDKRLQSIVVTSSISGEGKSEVCANLAASIAQTDRRVLLIDADMRSPNQHHLWNVLNTTGLSHVLVGEGNVDQAIQSINENLSLLPAGVVPPNPLALIDSERMAALIASFSQQFDYVIIDTPPLAGTADAAVLGNLADGILMIMRPRLVGYDSALSAKTLLLRSGANVLGLVANGVDKKVELSEYTYLPQPTPVAYPVVEPENDLVTVASSRFENDSWE